MSVARYLTWPGADSILRATLRPPGENAMIRALTALAILALAWMNSTPALAHAHHAHAGHQVAGNASLEVHSAASAPQGRLDQRASNRNRFKAQKLIDSSRVEHRLSEKPGSTFSHDALDATANLNALLQNADQAECSPGGHDAHCPHGNGGHSKTCCCFAAGAAIACFMIEPALPQTPQVRSGLRLLSWLQNTIDPPVPPPRG